MTYLILISTGVILFVAFVGLTMAETRNGFRVFAGPRSWLDRRAYRFFFVAQHVDWPEFLAHAVRGLFARIAHDIAFASLAIVRFIERQLTRIVRYLRDRRPNVLAPKPSRESMLSQSISYIQNRLHRPKKERE